MLLIETPSTSATAVSRANWSTVELANMDEVSPVKLSFNDDVRLALPEGTGDGAGVGALDGTVVGSADGLADG